MEFTHLKKYNDEDSTNTLPTFIQKNNKTEQIYQINETKYKRHIFQQIITCYTHFLMVMCFEIIFYFNFIAPYEKKSIYKLITRAVDKIMDETHLSNDLSTDLEQIFETVCNSEFSYNSGDIHNNNLYSSALYMMCGCIFGLVVMLVIETGILKLKTSFLQDFGYAIITVALIAAFDCIFFVYYISKYHIINYGEMICYLHDNLSD
jgi:hypothetical protein